MMLLFSYIDCREAMGAIERASDLQSAYLKSLEQKSTVVKSLGIETFFRSGSHTSNDAPLSYNASSAKLGDRVINLTSMGVPFGLKGTVVAIHVSTGFVEVFR